MESEQDQNLQEEIKRIEQLERIAFYPVNHLSLLSQAEQNLERIALILENQNQSIENQNLLIKEQIEVLKKIGLTLVNIGQVMNNEENEVKEVNPLPDLPKEVIKAEIITPKDPVDRTMESKMNALKQMLANKGKK